MGGKPWSIDGGAKARKGETPMLEKAQEHAARPREQAMVRAMHELKRLGPPCARVQSHGRATHVVTIAGELRAVCETCARDLQLDLRVARQREQRAAMRARR
jgi:hypothetical protein